MSPYCNTFFSREVWQPHAFKAEGCPWNTYSGGEGFSFVFAKEDGVLTCATGLSTGQVSSEALCGLSGRELEIPADSRSSRRVCSFLHPQYLEKCLAYKRWLIHAGQINGHGSKCLFQIGSLSSANVNTLLFWCFHFIELSLQTQTNNFSLSEEGKG